jgi:hypothetical protein
MKRYYTVLTENAFVCRLFFRLFLWIAQLEYKTSETDIHYGASDCDGYRRRTGRFTADYSDEGRTEFSIGTRRVKVTLCDNFGETHLALIIRK